MRIKLLLYFFLFTFSFFPGIAQVPQGFNYQALAGDASGNPLKNTDLQVRISILSDTIIPVIIWEELHPSIRANSQGIFSLVVGTGERQTASTATTFSKINWSATAVFLKTQILYQGAWKSMGSAKLWSVPYAMVAGDLSSPVKKLSVAGETADMEEALFEVRNKSGQTIFAVYNQGVRIYVADVSKGAKGGFAIGGFGSAKQPAQNYFVVKPDTIRMYIDDTPEKGAKGGFAIGGFGSSKSPSRQLLVINPDSIRAYIDTNSGKGAKGGFAIGGFGSSKATGEEYLRVTRDSTRIYLNDTGTKGAKGGFAIGGFGSSKGAPEDYFLVSPDSTRVYVRKDALNGSSTFNIVSIGQDLTQKSLMTANPDTVSIAGVLNLQNNLVVSGNIDVGGTINEVSDIDGNKYGIVKIGTQVWMAENLKTTRYNDGTAIPNVTDNTAWTALSTPAYCWYNNDAATYKATYGALYNWYAVDAISNGGRNVCPTGWHVPTNDEWQYLVMDLDPNALFSDTTNLILGGKLKESGTTHWNSPNVGATNEIGFTALPGGFRIGYDGTFYDIGAVGSWWSATEGGATVARSRNMDYSNSSFNPNFNDYKLAGLSVRCIKDI